MDDKLSERFEGPFQVIVRQRNQVTYIVKDCETGNQQRVHHTQLRRFYLPPKYLVSHPAYSRIVNGWDPHLIVQDTTGSELEVTDPSAVTDCGECVMHGVEWLTWSGDSDSVESDSEERAESSDGTSDYELDCETHGSLSIDHECEPEWTLRDSGMVSNKRNCKWGENLKRICEVELGLGDKKYENQSWSLLHEHSEFWNLNPEIKIISDTEVDWPSVIEMLGTPVSNELTGVGVSGTSTSDSVVVTPPSPFADQTFSSPISKLPSNTHTFLDGSIDEKKSLLTARCRAKQAVWLSADLEALDLAVFNSKDAYLSSMLSVLAHRKVELFKKGPISNGKRLKAIRADQEILYPYREEAEGVKLLNRNLKSNLISGISSVTGQTGDGSGVVSNDQPRQGTGHEMCTRSKGEASPHSNVQSSILEYRKVR